MTRLTRARLALVIVAAAALVLAATAAARTHASTITIGWAFDSKGAMAPFDGPALAAANVRVKQLNAKGGVDGKRIVIKTCDTQGNKPTVAKACAQKLLGQGANVIFTTCDVDFAAPVVQEAINRGVLAIAPCIGTDQMGPKRFGAKGRLAFSFGNVAQDEGSAMADFAWKKGWRTAAIATDTVIVYFKNVTAAFTARFKQRGGKIVANETYQSLGSTNVQNAVSRLNNVDADVVVTATAGAFGALSTLVSGMRSLGNDTPILNSWAGDGTYWLPKDPKVTNYWFVTFASAFGNDPNKAVNKLAKQVKAGTGGFITGPAAIDGLVAAIKRAHGSTNGTALATQMEKFKNVPTLSGLVSFSKKLHTVFGRQYRVIQIQNNVPRVVATIKAKVVPHI
jgi:branched-chain amino acid transport system substrate-binding protein